MLQHLLNHEEQLMKDKQYKEVICMNRTFLYLEKIFDDFDNAKSSVFLIFLNDLFACYMYTEDERKSFENIVKEEKKLLKAYELICRNGLKVYHLLAFTFGTMAIAYYKHDNKKAFKYCNLALSCINKVKDTEYLENLSILREKMFIAKINLINEGGQQ